MHPNVELIHLQTNGVQLRMAIERRGPLVILVHGWPKLWYPWRH